MQPLTWKLKTDKPLQGQKQLKKLTTEEILLDEKNSEKVNVQSNRFSGPTPDWTKLHFPFQKKNHDENSLEKKQPANLRSRWGDQKMITSVCYFRTNNSPQIFLSENPNQTARNV